VDKLQLNYKPKTSGAAKSSDLIGALSGVNGIADARELPSADLASLWDSIYIDQTIKDRLLGLAVLNYQYRGRLDRNKIPMHGAMLLYGPPGTGKTSLARGLAQRISETVKSRPSIFVEIDPHALTASALGKSQREVTRVMQLIADAAHDTYVIVLLDEVETLASDRKQLSLEANPVDVHRATDAVLAQLDLIAAKHPNVLFIATSNFPEAIDEAFLSRADIALFVGLPNEDARRAIVDSSLQELATVAPKVSALLTKANLDQLVKASDGLDGRQIRKSVLVACATSKELAMNLDKLTINDIMGALATAQDKPGRRSSK
jgi:SpoVK/Ycf46/Vps4 family AAA+-type ATPase